MQREEPSPGVTSGTATPLNRPLPPLSELAPIPPTTSASQATVQPADSSLIGRRDVSAPGPTTPILPSGPASASVVREVPTLPIDLIAPPFLVAAVSHSTITHSTNTHSHANDVHFLASGATEFLAPVAAPVSKTLATANSVSSATALIETESNPAVVSESPAIPPESGAEEISEPQVSHFCETLPTKHVAGNAEQFALPNDGINADSIAAFFENTGADLMEHAEQSSGAPPASKPRIAPMLFPRATAVEQMHIPGGKFPGHPDTENSFPEDDSQNFMATVHPTHPLAAAEKIPATAYAVLSSGPGRDHASLATGTSQPRTRTPLTRQNLQRKPQLPASTKLRATTDAAASGITRIDFPGQTTIAGIDQTGNTPFQSGTADRGHAVRVSNSPDVVPENRMAVSPPGETSQTPTERRTMASRPTQQRFVDGPHSLASRGPHFDVVPPRRTNPTSIIGQTLAYIGVLGLTIGTSMVILGHFGGYAEYTPTGWLVTTVAQMLLFLGVINLVSGGMEQNNEDVSRRIQLLGDQLLRIEQATSQSQPSPGADDPGPEAYSDASEYSDSSRQVTTGRRG